ncbi:hypothetical protein RZS08_35895, partial [Arthrospira platensis SPKY1]|nr:hypothetical protein [Arthrospira platensis SPKY1]
PMLAWMKRRLLDETLRSGAPPRVARRLPDGVECQRDSGRLAVFELRGAVNRATACIALPQRALEQHDREARGATDTCRIPDHTRCFVAGAGSHTEAPTIG